MNVQPYCIAHGGFAPFHKINSIDFLLDVINWCDGFDNKFKILKSVWCVEKGTTYFKNTSSGIVITGFKLICCDIKWMIYLQCDYLIENRLYIYIIIRAGNSFVYVIECCMCYYRLL